MVSAYRGNIVRANRRRLSDRSPNISARILRSTKQNMVWRRVTTTFFGCDKSMALETYVYYKKNRRQLVN